jgi:glycosyltransferase involved in cell wall biosynthesis
VTQASIELSVVIPAHQEHDVLTNTLSVVTKIVRGITENYEVIVVDDGSRDETFADVEAFHKQDPRVKGIRLSRQFGKEAAMLAGLARAHGAAVVTIDGDLQHPPELIPEFYEKWRGGAKIVHGVKRDRLYGGWFHRVAAQAFNRTFSWAAGFDIVGSSDYKLLDASVVRLLVQQFPEHGRFHRGLATWVGFRQETVIFAVRERPAGKSRWRLYDLFRYGWNTLTSYSSLPLKLVPIMGAVMLVVSVALSIEALVSRFSGNAVSGFATLEITILFTGSMLMIGLGIIGQYLSRVYDELKQRPIFLVDEEVGFKSAPER